MYILLGDTAWFTSHTNRYDYIDYVGFGIKSDKNSDSERLGDKGVQTNTNVGFAELLLLSNRIYINCY